MRLKYFYLSEGHLRYVYFESNLNGFNVKKSFFVVVFAWFYIRISLIRTEFRPGLVLEGQISENSFLKG